MSTFDGKIVEIPDISVDRFEDTSSSIYFLSHCHTDHMKGLDDWSFQSHLSKRPNVYLYGSDITINIIRHKFPEITSNLQELPVGTPSLIEFPDDPNRTITVTPISAGHCPGSVMFLFETDKTVLYTGDFRIQLIDFKKFKPLYSHNSLKKFDKIYLDTTFFNKAYEFLPPRPETAQALTKIITDWLNQSETRMVKLLLSAKYGSEYLFAVVSKATGMPIHVSREVYETYKCVPELDGTVTVTGEATRLHASCGHSYNTTCTLLTDVLTIKPSALTWRYRKAQDGISVQQDTFVRVCYSCHASFGELKEFLAFLKPAQIEPNVVPDSPSEKQRLYADIQEVMQSYRNDEWLQKHEIEAAQNGLTSVQTEICDPGCVVEDVSLDLGSPPKNLFKRKRTWLEEVPN